MDAPGTDRPTRRELLSRGILVAGAGAVASGVLGASQAQVASAQPETEAGALGAVLEAELLVEYAYAHVLRSRLLAVSPARVAAGLLAHERAHVSLLRAWLSKLGGTQPPAPEDDHGADRRLAACNVSGSLAQLRSEHDALRLLIEVEAVAVGAYYRGIATLVDPALVRSAAEMLASEAQHATLLSELLHPGDVSRAVPGPFVTGMR